MATPMIDVSGLNYFAPVFSFLFVWALMYAFFQWSKLFGDIKILHAIMAVVIAFFAAVFSPAVRDLIQYVIPWFVFLIVFIVMLIIILKIFGVTDDNLHGIIKEPGVYWTVLIIIIIILIGGLSSIFGQDSLDYTNSGNSTNGNTQVNNGGEGTYYGPGNPGTGSGSTNTGDFEKNVGATFYHPKILGMIFLLVTIAVGVRMLSGPSGP